MRKKIGEILVDSGLVSERIIQEALDNKKENQKIGDYLIERGYVKEDLMYSKLSVQMQVPLIRMFEIDVSPIAVKSIPKDLLSKYTAFPIDITGSLITLAMENPLDNEALEKLESIVGFEIKAVYGIKSEILDYISKYYDLDDSMVELFDMIDDESRNVNELQIADTFFQQVTNERPYSISIKEVRNRYEISIGDKLFTKYEKDLKYLVDFIKRITGYTEDNDFFSVIYKQKDYNIRVELRITSKANVTTYWIECTLIDNLEYELPTLVEGETHSNKLTEVISSDIIIVFNKGYKNTQDFKNLLRDYHLITNKNILVNTTDVSYSSYLLDIIDQPNDELDNFSSFGDVFVLDFGWELDKETVNMIIRLLKDNKQVILHYPLNPESIEQNSPLFRLLSNTFKVSEVAI